MLMTDTCDYQHFLNVALDAAHQAGDLLREKFGTALHIDKKGRINVVTEADLASEKLIRAIITSKFPDHEILGEEGGLTIHSGAPRWVVDPLDGTTNFAQGYPFFSVSIALEMGGVPVVGVVHDPTHKETFYASKGGGAYLNGKPIRVSDHRVFEEALLVTGMPYDVGDDPDLHVDMFKAMLVKARGIRRDGSAALDLSYIACGRFDAYWEVGLHPWDVAAGLVIVNEAGGKVTNYTNTPHNMMCRDLVASNSHMHPQMLQVLQPFVERLYSSKYWENLQNH